MGGGKRRGEAIAMMITASKMVEVLTMTTCTTKGSDKEDGAVRHPVAAAVAASPRPPPPCMPCPLPLLSWWCGRWRGGWRGQWSEQWR
jgi:hypothetical protein